MNIPNLPTDSLYKFLAITGLVLIGTSFVLPQWVIYNLQLQSITFEGEVRVLQLESRALDRESRALDREVARMKEKAQTSEKQGDTRYHQDEIDFMKRNNEFAIKSAQALTKGQALQYVTSQLRLWRIYSYLGILIGLLLSLSGFYLWHTRLQKHQDSMMRNQASSK